MSETEAWTIGRLLEWTTQFLADHDAESPRLDAEVLLAHARGCERIELYTTWADEADEPLRQRYRELVRQRADGVPVAYLVGHREFYSLRFRVTPDVLIPRPETELLVVRLLDLAAGEGNSRPVRIADVGAGSGVLAVRAAVHLADAQVAATDISPAALAVARENAQTHGVADRIAFVESDLLTAVPAAEPFDFILSNPPYVSEAEMNGLPREVRDHEPHVALAAGPGGTDVIARLIPQAAERLRAGGWLIMEISPMIAEEVCEIVNADGRFANPVVEKDLAGLPRVVSAQRTK